MLLLDTHVWVWHVEGDARRIGRHTRQRLDREASRNLLRVSPLSAFEVSLLHAAGRLRLARPLEQWIQAALEPVGILLAPLSLEATIDAGAIGRANLPDPLDRLLIATARQSDGTFVTADRRILDYAAATSAVRVHDARR